MSKKLADNTELLSNVAHIIDPHPSHRAPEAVSEGVPFAGIGDLNVAGELLPGKGRIVPAKTLAEHALRYKLSGNTIGFGRVATIGKVIDFRESISDLTISPTMAVIEPFAVNKDFLLAALEGVSVRKKIDQWLTGSTRSSLGIELLREIPLPKFDQHSQKTIGAVYRALVTNIEKTEALIEKYQQIKAGLMHDLFTRGIGADGQLRPPREQAPALYQQTPIGWIPKEWDIVSLEDSDIAIIDGDRGENYPKGHELMNDGFCLFLSATNVTSNGFKFDKIQFISEEKHSLLGTGSMLLGDVVITTRGTVGNIAYFDNTIPFNDMRINSGMVILRSGQKDLTTDFLYCSLRNYIFSREYKRVISGSAQPQLPIKDFKRFTVVIPSLNEQKALVTRASSVDNVLSRENEILGKLKKQKIGLMNDLLTGKVPVNVVQAETAHV